MDPEAAAQVLTYRLKPQPKVNIAKIRMVAQPLLYSCGSASNTL
jgi:predicted double-glycine peptidase